jgi:hypothetical protein
MPIDFPASPTNNQEYTYNNTTWIWNNSNTAWELKGTNLASWPGSTSIVTLGNITSQIVSTRANSTTTGEGQIYLNGSTGNRIDFSNAGYAAPSMSSRSVGTKVVLYPNLSGTEVDYALGIEMNSLWYSIPQATTQFNYKWYAGTTHIASLGGTGNFLVTGSLTGKQLIETRVTMPANNIDLSTGNFFTKTISGATTLTVSNIPTSGNAASFILDLTNGGSATITWWSGVKWAGGVAPTLTSAGRDALGFFTHDAGTNWSGLVLGKDIK